jgi:hypothetical protein
MQVYEDGFGEGGVSNTTAWLGSAVLFGIAFGVGGVGMLLLLSLFN